MELKGLNKPNSPELDHIIPISKGGHHLYSNVQLLCRACNGSKRDEMPVESLQMALYATGGV